MSHSSDRFYTETLNVYRKVVEHKSYVSPPVRGGYVCPCSHDRRVRPGAQSTRSKSLFEGRLRRGGVSTVSRVLRVLLLRP